MIDLTSIPEEELGQTQKEIRRHIIDRGWKALIPYKGSAHYFLTRADGKEMHIFSSTPPTTSYAAASLANDKFATYELLLDSNTPQLETVKVGSTGDLQYANELLSRVGKVVAKPIDGGHGHGITIGITNEEELAVAVEVANQHTKNVRAALIQTHYDHDVIYDLRILCIDYQYAAGIQRVAARVFGDDVNTIKELIDIENKKEDRGKAYHARLATIDTTLAMSYLKENANTVPANGEEVQVIGVANYGAGGETVDVTDNIPDWLIECAVDVAKRCGLAVAGVDFMLAQFPQKHMSREELDPAMTEVNKAPLLTMHDTPTSGVSRHVMTRYIDYLESL